MSELFNKEDIFTIVNAEEAKQYIGKEGYFASNLAELKKNINSDSHILSDILDDNASARFMYVDKCTDMVFELFLPADKVKQTEKKWRPFRYMDEFSYHIFMVKNFHSILHTIKVEDKQTSIRYELNIIGEFEKGLVLPIYGALTFQELFERLKIYNENHQIGWQPFGVEE